MAMDPLTRKLMEKLEASGRANVRLDADGTIMWNDPTTLTGIQSLRPDMFADALVRLDQEEQARRDAAYISPSAVAPVAAVPIPSPRRFVRLLLPLLLILLAVGGIALVYSASHKAPIRTPLGPDCKYDTVCLTTEVNNANAAVDAFASSCNAALVSATSPAATAAILVSRCDTAVADRDTSVATAFVANATLQALSSSP